MKVGLSNCFKLTVHIIPVLCQKVINFPGTDYFTLAKVILNNLQYDKVKQQPIFLYKSNQDYVLLYTLAYQLHDTAGPVDLWLLLQPPTLPISSVTEDVSRPELKTILLLSSSCIDCMITC